jgi:peptidylprolyl isomerase
MSHIGLDDSFAAQDVLAKELTVFQELMIPDNFKHTLPSEYDSLPQLTRRANVQMVIKKPGGAQFDIDGKLYDRVNLVMVVDGYNAPVTGGNFVDLVDSGFYNNRPVST